MRLTPGVRRSADGKTQKLTGRPMDPNDALRMIKRRAKEARLSEAICCHTLRATGVTAYLEDGGIIEKALRLADHESPQKPPRSTIAPTTRLRWTMWMHRGQVSARIRKNDCKI